MNHSIPISRPYIREWEINENSTHYDRMMAAPSDLEMRIMWILWSAITAVVVLVAGVVFIAVVSSRKARGNPFNIYLIFLMIPDLFMSFGCFITCTLSASVGHYYSEFSCYFQSFYLVFGICANAWMNALIARELYTVLLRSATLRTFQAPKKSKVIINSFLVYIGSSCVAAMGLFRMSWWPHKTGLLMGTACVPTDYDAASTTFFYCIYFPVLMGLPMGYVLYTCFRIQRDGLMPRKGKRRLLTIYFLRLAAVFVVMWLPAIFFFFIVGGWVNYWAVWAGGAWSHLQGLVSAVVSLMKPDVHNAVCQLLQCKVTEFEDIHDDGKDTGPHSKSENVTTNRAKKSNLKCENAEQGGRSDRKLESSFPVTNFSEIVGWKTQVNDGNDDDDPEQQLSANELVERWKSQIGRKNNFSEAVGWKTQAEPMAEYSCEELNIQTTSIVSDLNVDTSEDGRQKNGPQSSDDNCNPNVTDEDGRQKNVPQTSNDNYNPKVSFYETEWGKYYS